MAVVKIFSGKVVQVWRDVETVADAVVKYGLDPTDLVEADHAPGTLYDGVEFSTPVIPPRQPEPESPERRAIRALAASIGSVAVAAVEREIGPPQ